MPLRRILVAFVLLCAAVTAQADGVGDLEAFYNNVDSLSAEFEQEQKDDGGQTLNRLGGARAQVIVNYPNRSAGRY